MVVMHLKDSLGPGDFLRTIHHLPVALSLYIKVPFTYDKHLTTKPLGIKSLTEINEDLADS